MKRHPVDKYGLALTPQELGFEVVPFERRVTNQHHRYYERGHYIRSPLHIAFRGLITHVHTMRINDHQRLHELYRPPQQPTDTQMRDVLEEYITTNGVLHIVREKRTHEVREIMPTSMEMAAIRGVHEVSQTNAAGHRFTAR